MQWKKSRLIVHQWESLGFLILETLPIDGRPFTLRSLTDEDAEPMGFSTLAEAQTHADLLNELAVTKANNDTLRAELARLRDGGIWEPHPSPEDFEKPVDEDDGRGIPTVAKPECPVCASKEYDRQSGCKACSYCEGEIKTPAPISELLAARNGHAPRVYAGEEDAPF